MESDLPFGDFGVAIIGDPDFSALVERGCWQIAGVAPFRLARLNERELIFTQPDLVVLAGYMERVEDVVLDTWPVIGFHPSLLPRYRGGSAVKWQLYYGERRLGATVYRLRPGQMDAGPIVAQRAIETPEVHWTAGSLYRSLRAIGVDLLVRAVAAYARGSFTETPQDERLATWHPLLRPGQSPTEIDHAQQEEDPAQEAGA